MCGRTDYSYEQDERLSDKELGSQDYLQVVCRDLTSSPEAPFPKGFAPPQCQDEDQAFKIFTCPNPSKMTLAVNSCKESTTGHQRVQRTHGSLSHSPKAVAIHALPGVWGDGEGRSALSQQGQGKQKASRLLRWWARGMAGHLTHRPGNLIRGAEQYSS